MNNFARDFLIGWIALSPALAQATETGNVVIAPHAPDLVRLQGDRLVPFKSPQFLKVPYTILYFGAGWCPDCRRFSPALVSAYHQQPKGAQRFEVLFLTMDKTAADMLRFMSSEKMTWPALAFEKAGRAEDLKKYYSGHGIPCLTVIDQKGTVVLQSKDDQDAIEVLGQLQKLLKRSI